MAEVEGGYTTALITPDQPKIRNDYEKEINDYIQTFRYFQRMLTDKHNQWVLWWRRYLGDISGVLARMSPEEKQWRAAVTVPWDYSGIQTIVAHMTDLIRAVTPPVQAQGVGGEDTKAGPIENLFDYTCRQNYFDTKFAESMTTDACVQGVSFAKLVWKSKCRTYTFTPSPRDILRFDASIREAENVLGIRIPTDDALSFNIKRLQINAILKDKGLQIPPVPAMGPKEVYSFRGPSLKRISGFDFYYEPTVKEMQDQGIVIHRMFKPDRWLKDQVKNGIFDEKAVEKAIGRPTSNFISPDEQSVLEMQQLGTAGTDAGNNPAMSDISEIYEVFAPDLDPPYAVIVNESPVPVNKNIGEYQYEHGMIPFGAVVNVDSPFDCTGISEYQRTKTLYDEADQIRSARLDAVQMTVMPALKKKKGWGLTTGHRNPRPGRVYEVDDMADMQPLYAMDKQVLTAANELAYLEQEADAANGTYSSLRGAPGQVGRISATEQGGRQKSVLTRIALRLSKFESGLNPLLPQVLSLWNQFSDEDTLRNIGGGENPLAELSKDKLIEALEQDYRFAFSGQNLDPGMQVQQIGQVIQMFAPLGVFQPGGGPPGIMELFSQVLQALRFKNIPKILSTVVPTAAPMPPQPTEGEQANSDQQVQDQAEGEAGQEADGMAQAQAMMPQQGVVQ